MTKVERVLREMKKEKIEEPEAAPVPVTQKKRKSTRPKKVAQPVPENEKVEKVKETSTKTGKNKPAKTPAAQNKLSKIAARKKPSKIAAKKKPVNEEENTGKTDEQNPTNQRKTKKTSEKERFSN